MAVSCSAKSWWPIADYLIPKSLRNFPAPQKNPDFWWVMGQMGSMFILLGKLFFRLPIWVKQKNHQGSIHFQPQGRSPSSWHRCRCCRVAWPEVEFGKLEMVMLMILKKHDIGYPRVFIEENGQWIHDVSLKWNRSLATRPYKICVA